MFYHTQEHRACKLTSPKKCYSGDAWLGEAYYFWQEEEFAHKWGIDCKTRTGYYDIYQADIEINLSNVLDTVFNEEHYKQFLKMVECCAKNITRKTLRKPSLFELYTYMKEHKVLEGVLGIRFQDLPKNNDLILVNDFFYKKRIQLAIYDLALVKSFELFKTERC